MNEEIIILHEDNHLLVVVKPQNMPCCEDESKDLDLLTYLKNYIKEKYKKEGNVYLGLVHRLDRPTGGIMVFAKSSKAASRLSEGMREGDFEKLYLTVVVGTPREEKERLTHYLKKNEINNIVYVVPQTTLESKKAELEYKTLESKGGYSLVEIRLLTGRSHQIRVQMNHIGNPVLGDVKYGGENAKKGKLALWAYKLEFTHPVSKDRMVFKVEPPKENTVWKNFKTDLIMQVVK